MKCRAFLKIFNTLAVVPLIPVLRSESASADFKMPDRHSDELIKIKIGDVKFIGEVKVNASGYTAGLMRIKAQNDHFISCVGIYGRRMHTGTIDSKNW